MYQLDMRNLGEQEKFKEQIFRNIEESYDLVYPFER